VVPAILDVGPTREHRGIDVLSHIVWKSPKPIFSVIVSACSEEEAGWRLCKAQNKDTQRRLSPVLVLRTECVRSVNLRWWE